MWVFHMHCRKRRMIVVTAHDIPHAQEIMLGHTVLHIRDVQSLLNDAVMVYNKDAKGPSIRFEGDDKEQAPHSVPLVAHVLLQVDGVLERTFSDMVIMRDLSPDVILAAVRRGQGRQVLRAHTSTGRRLLLDRPLVKQGIECGEVVTMHCTAARYRCTPF